MRTIGIISDIHYGPLREFRGEMRGDGSSAKVKLPLLLEDMNRKCIEYLIDLGDNISEENSEKDYSRLCEIKQAFDASKIRTFHILGNHECTTLDKKVSANVLGLKRDYYSVNIWPSYKLIFLDSQDGTCPGNIDDAQLSWLEKELNEPMATYIFSHQSLAEPDLSRNAWFKDGHSGGLIKNREDARKIISKGNVRLVVSGHLHETHMQKIGKVQYCTIGSWSEFNPAGNISESYAIIELGRGCCSGSSITLFSKDNIISYQIISG